jgi:hypothetical protein
VIWNDSSLFMCAISTLFSDELGGLYGSYGSFPTPFIGFQSCDYLVSMVQFGCVQCPFPLQARGQGHSNGDPSNITNPYCFSCPFGASCYGGVVVAQPGYWGVTDDYGAPSFVLCPSGYCCSSSANCLSLSSCAGSRTGTLCGECLPGYVEAMGSTLCVPVTKCAADKAIFWPLFVFAMFLDAVIQLTFVSRVWNPSPARPDATFKCLLYFFQASFHKTVYH